MKKTIIFLSIITIAIFVGIFFHEKNFLDNSKISNLPTKPIGQSEDKLDVATSSETVKTIELPTDNPKSSSLITPFVRKSEDGISVTANSENVKLLEQYFGATWSADSKNVYFARHVSISFISAKIIDGIGKQETQSLISFAEKDGQKFSDKEKEEAEVLSYMRAQALIEKDFYKPIYEKLLILKYNVDSKKVSLISTIDLHDEQPLVEFLDIIKDNSLIVYESLFPRIINIIDLNTLKVTKKDISDLPDTYAIDPVDTYKDHFASSSGDYIENRKYSNGLYHGCDYNRYISPDHHSFIQINSSLCVLSSPGLDAVPDQIGIYTNPEAYLKTLKEMGWGGGTLDSSFLSQINQYTPSFLKSSFMYSREESSVRTSILGKNVPIQTGPAITGFAPIPSSADPYYTGVFSLWVEPKSINLTAIRGASFSNGSDINIYSNVYGTPYHMSVSPQVDWLIGVGKDTENGTTDASIGFQAKNIIENFNVGNYKTSIIISSPNKKFSTITVPVELKITAQ